MIVIDVTYVIAFPRTHRVCWSQFISRDHSSVVFIMAHLYMNDRQVRCQ